MSEALRIRPLRLVLAWLLSAAAVLVAAWAVPGVAIEGAGGALVAAAVIGVLNAVLPPLLAALRLPFTLLIGLLLVLALDAAMFLLSSRIAPGAISVDSFGSALLAAFVVSAVSVVLDPLFRMNDDDTYMLRVTQRIARRTGGQTGTDVPRNLLLRIERLRLPALPTAHRDRHAAQP